jgi:hypothetical protein
MKFLATILMSLWLILPTILGQESNKTSPTSLEVHLFANKRAYRIGEDVKAKVELSNVSGKTILVGREISTIDNWPFVVKLRLVDATGKYAQSGGAGFVDPPPRADFSIKDGVLRWWLALDPESSYAKTFCFHLKPAVPGHYFLRCKYSSLFLQDASLLPSEIPVFKGELESKPVEIEVFTDDTKASKNLAHPKERK